jgi:hypothetical protein
MAPSKKIKGKSTKTKKSPLPITTRLNKLPFHLQKHIYDIVTEEQYPLKEEIIRRELANNYIVGLDLMIYNPSKIRKTLKIKQYNKEKQIRELIMDFRKDYIFPLTNLFLEIQNIYFLFDQESRDYSYYESNINYAEKKLRQLINDFNIIATKVEKLFNSYIIPDRIQEINNFIMKLNMILSKKLPLLRNYGSNISYRTTSNNSKINSKTRKIRSL